MSKFTPLSFYLIISIIISLLTLSGCSNNTVTPAGPRSDITRSGKFISFTSNLSGNYDIFLAQVDGDGNLVTTGLVYPNNPFNLTHSFNLLAHKQSNWSPDGRVLVFSSAAINGEEDIYAYFFNSSGLIDTTVAALGNPKLLFVSGNRWDENPSFSPDGKYLIFDRRFGIDTTHPRHLFIGDVSGSGSTFTVANIRPITDTSTTKDEYNAKWAPRINVRKVAYESAGSTTATDHDIWIIDPLNPSDNIDFYEPGRSGYPAWAPECNGIIFENDQGNGGFYQIVSLGYPGGGNTTIIVPSNGSQNYRYPTRLPNGNLIAYIQISNSTGNGNIYIVPTNGGTSVKLLSSAPQFDNFNNLYPAW